MKIEKSTYQGYLWYSNEDYPNVIDNKEFELEISDTKNPFIVEGLLYDKKTSISIKYVDGKYFCHKYVMSELKGKYGKQRSVRYIANRMYKDKNKTEKYDNLYFKQYWSAEHDQFCGADVLQPAEFVFVGFKDEKED